jgi:hypothetical protein
MASKYLDYVKSLPLRKYLELSVILDFFALTALCALDLISEAPSVRFPVGAPKGRRRKRTLSKSLRGNDSA